MDSGPRRSSRLAERIDAVNNVIKADPAEVLPEILEMIAKMCCAATLSSMRLVNTTWRKAAENPWRELVIILVGGGSTVTIENTKQMQMEKFMEEIKDPAFKYGVKPFKRFLLHAIPFSNKSDTITDFMELCLPTITHLALVDIIFNDRMQFSDVIFNKLVNLKDLVLVRPVLRGSGRPDESKFEFPVNQKLCRFKVDFTDNTLANLLRTQSTALGFACPWKKLLSSWPNLKIVGIALKERYYLVFDIRSLLQAVKELSIEGKLCHLKDFYISLNDFKYIEFNVERQFMEISNPNFGQILEDLVLCDLNLETLEVEIDYKKDHARIENPVPATGNIETKIVEKFHTTLQRLKLYLIHEANENSEFPHIELPNVTKLAVSYSLAQSLRNGKFLPKLEQLEILSRPFLPEKEPSESNNIRWLDEDNYIVDPSAFDDKSQCQQDTKDYLDLDPDYSVTVEDHLEPDDTMSECSSQSNLVNVCDVETHGPLSDLPGFLFGGCGLYNDSAKFENVTRFRMEHGCTCTVFATLSNWMQNVTNLEIRLAACSFPLLCEKWGKLEKLTLLMCRNPDNDCKMFLPVDDCVITGRRHLSRPELKSLYDKYIDFCHGSSDKPPVTYKYFVDSDDNIRPNITYLQNLKYFKMEHDKYFRNEYPVLSDESVFRGFYKLPKLEYLEIVADLNATTVTELFRRVPKCIIYRPKPRPGLTFYARKNLTVVPMMIDEA